MSTESQDRVIQHCGERFRIYGRAWWTDAALDKGDGRIEVARIHAQSTHLRTPSQAQLDADPNLNRYHLSPENQGPLALYMLGLTDAELQELAITPGELVFPDVVDGPRPASNLTEDPASMAQAKQVLDWLENDCIGRPREY